MRGEPRPGPPRPGYRLHPRSGVTTERHRTVEKEQVTIDLGGAQTAGPLGTPVLLVSLVLDRHPQSLVILGKTVRGIEELSRYGLPEGALSSPVADVVSGLVGDAIYHQLVQWKGIQTDLGVVYG